LSILIAILLELSIVKGRKTCS